MKDHKLSLMAFGIAVMLGLSGCFLSQQVVEDVVAAPVPPPDPDGDGVAQEQDACPGTVSGVLVDHKGCEVIFELLGVNFSFNSADLTAEGKAALDSALPNLVANKSKRFEVAGHTDSTGPEEYNQDLSQQRANIVAEYLLAHDVVASRLDVVGYGQTHPADSNATRAGRAQNRRVELIDLGSK